VRGGPEKTDPKIGKGKRKGRGDGGLKGKEREKWGGKKKEATGYTERSECQM